MRERARDLEPPLVAVGEVVRVLVVAAAEAAELEQLVGLLPRGALLALQRRRLEHRAQDPALQPRVHADEHVLERGHALEEADVLERAPDAALGDRVRRLAGDVVAVEDDLARGRLVDAGEHVEERRLAGAVRPDQADDRAAPGS